MAVTSDGQVIKKNDDELPMFERIVKDINERMFDYTDSRFPTADEVTIAWLVSEVNRLRDGLTDVTNVISNIRQTL